MNAVFKEVASSAKRLYFLTTRINAERVGRHGRVLLGRGRQWRRRAFTKHPAGENFPIFIAGSNRSGTQMVCRALGNHRHGWDYPEADHSIAFENYYLRSPWLVRLLIARAPAPAVPTVAFSVSSGLTASTGG